MEKKVILSADSTCDLSAELIERYDVQICPYHIILDGAEYIDNVTITPSELFSYYREHKVLPKTSAINVHDFIGYFKKWTDEGHEVVHIGLSSAITSTYQNCMIAAQEIEGLYPVDSRNLSTGTGLLALEAGELIRQGKTGAEIQEILTAARSRVHTSFILNTLEFMAAGGRCSQIASLGANLLKLKPCIEMSNDTGKMSVGKKYRGKLADVLQNYVTERLAMYDNIDTRHIFITYSSIDPELIETVRQTIEGILHFDEIFVTSASCTISCHCGPDTLGILFMTKE